MGNRTNDEISNLIEEEINIDKSKTKMEYGIVDDKNEDTDDGYDEVFIRLDPVENLADCMALAIEGQQIHTMIMQLIKMEHIFSEKMQGLSAEESEKIFTDECIKVYNKKSLLKTYIARGMTSMMEDERFNYKKILPRLLLMASYYKKKKNPDEIKYYKLTEIDEDGNYIISNRFQKVVKAKSLTNTDFALEFIIELWTKRMSEKTSFEVLKKKIQEFLKTNNYLQKMKEEFENYLVMQNEAMKKHEIMRQKVQSKHSKLRKD